MKSILVGIDLGEASTRALEQARMLAACFEGSLHLLCVVQNPFSLPWAPAAPHGELTALLERMRQDASAHLEQRLTPDERRKYCAKLVTRVGKPADEILAYAREHAITLIVMGRDGHGSPTAAAAAIGSVAHAVACEAACPVLLVPAA
ncbi:MAG TPA: universal stress protein [Vicinamibacterales bacterium]